MVTARQTRIGLMILLLVALLIVVAAMYWQHITGSNILHLLADGSAGSVPIGQGC